MNRCSISSLGDLALVTWLADLGRSRQSSCKLRKINNLKQTNQLTDETVDNWICTITENFERLVHDEIRLVLHHRREIAINIRIVIDDRATAAFNEREKVIERLEFTTINLDKLTPDQMKFVTLIWHDLVRFTNPSLVIPLFRREPP